MCWTLGLGGDSPRLHGCGIGLLQDHRLIGSQLRGRFSSRTRLLVRLTCLKGGGTTSGHFFNRIHIQRDGWHNSTAWHVCYYRDSRDARLFHRVNIVMAGTSSSTRGMFSNTGLRLLDPGFVNFLVLRLQRSLSDGGGGWGWHTLRRYRCSCGSHCGGVAIGPDGRLFRFWNKKVNRRKWLKVWTTVLYVPGWTESYGCLCYITACLAPSGSFSWSINPALHFLLEPLQKASYITDPNMHPCMHSFFTVKSSKWNKNTKILLIYRQQQKKKIEQTLKTLKGSNNVTMYIWVWNLPWDTEAWDVVFSLSIVGVSATGQIINHRFPVWRTIKDRERSS